MALNCYSDKLPITIPAGGVAFIVGVNENALKAQSAISFRREENAEQSPLLWPDLLKVQEVKRKSGTDEFIWRCEVQNDSDGTVVKLRIPLRIFFGTSGKKQYEAFIDIESVSRQKPFIFYVVNSCPTSAQFLLQEKGAAKIAGEQSIREFDFIMTPNQ